MRVAMERRNDPLPALPRQIRIICVKEDVFPEILALSNGSAVKRDHIINNVEQVERNAKNDEAEENMLFNKMSTL